VLHNPNQLLPIMNRYMLSALCFGTCLMLQAQEKFTLYFDFDKDVPNQKSLARFTEWIKSKEDIAIDALEGDAGKTGNNYYNIDLSERRIKAVKNLLQSSSIQLDMSATEFHPFGESRSTSRYHAKDRRVVIIFRNAEDVPPAIESIPAKKDDPEDFKKQVNNAKVGDKIRLKNLYFFNNSDAFVPESTKVIRELLEVMQNNPTIRIDIQGHICCEVKERDGVSKKRALAVYNFLVRNGIDKTRLAYHSFGSSRPVYPLPEKSEAEADANRRVEIEIIER